MIIILAHKQTIIGVVCSELSCVFSISPSHRVPTRCERLNDAPIHFCRIIKFITIIYFNDWVNRDTFGQQGSFQFQYSYNNLPPPKQDTILFPSAWSKKLIMIISIIIVILTISFQASSGIWTCARQASSCSRVWHTREEWRRSEWAVRREDSSRLEELMGYGRIGGGGCYCSLCSILELRLR